MSPYKPIALTPLGKRPRAVPAVANAWKYLVGAHQTVSDLFDVINTLRSAKSGDLRGRLPKAQQDILRSAIVFTSAGVDTCCKRLVVDVLTDTQISHLDDQASRDFRRYVSAQLNAKVVPEWRVAILEQDPRTAMIARYAEDLTQGSVQGTKSLVKVGGALGLAAPWFKDREEPLNEFFRQRNQVVHDMDYLDTKSGRFDRAVRGPKDVSTTCDYVFQTIRGLVHEVAGCIRGSKLP